MRRFRPSEHERPLLLLAAFAVVLLATVSTTMASSATALPLIEGLRRDLAAISVQLERTEPAGEVRQSVAFNADLGDGGADFRQRSMATILRGAKRRLESLVNGYRQAGDARRTEAAESAQLELQELLGQVLELGNATDPTNRMWERERRAAEALVARLQDRLVLLLRPAPRPQGLG